MSQPLYTDSSTDEDALSSSDQLVILLHGLGGDHQAWTSIRKQLNKYAINSIAIDLQGHGGKSRKTNYQQFSLKQQAQEIEQIITTHSLSGKRIFLAGHCLGSLIAQQVAKNSKHITGLILIGSTTKMPSWVRLTKLDVIGSWLSQHVGSLLPTWHIEKERNYQALVGTSDFSVRRVFWDIAHTSLRTYCYTLSWVLRVNNQELAQKIRVPTLVIGGKQDRIFPMHLSSELAALIPNSTLRTIDSNHLLPINQSDDVAAAIVECVSRVT